MSGKPVKQRQPDAPKVSETPLESLTPQPTDSIDWVRHYNVPLFVGFACGVGVGTMENWIRVRPLYSGIHKVLGLGLALGLFFKFVDQTRQDRHREKDEILREYVLTHPEDFPPYERRQFKDILLPWNPQR